MITQQQLDRIMQARFAQRFYEPIRMTPEHYAHLIAQAEIGRQQISAMLDSRSHPTQHAVRRASFGRSY